MKLQHYVFIINALFINQWTTACLAQSPTERNKTAPYRKHIHKKGSFQNINNSASESAYGNYLKQRVWPAWVTPERHQTVSMVVSFEIDKDGNVSELKIKRSSGDIEFDNSALDAVRNVSPFEPLPAGNATSADVALTFWQNDDKSGASVGIIFAHQK